MRKGQGICPRPHSQQVKKVRSQPNHSNARTYTPNHAATLAKWAHQASSRSSNQIDPLHPTCSPSISGRGALLCSSHQVLVSPEEVSPLAKGGDSSHRARPARSSHALNNHPQDTGSQASLIANTMVSWKLLPQKGNKKFSGQLSNINSRKTSLPSIPLWTSGWTCAAAVNGHSDIKGTYQANPQSSPYPRFLSFHCHYHLA